MKQVKHRDYDAHRITLSIVGCTASRNAKGPKVKCGTTALVQIKHQNGRNNSSTIQNIDSRVARKQSRQSSTHFEVLILAILLCESVWDASVMTINIRMVAAVAIMVHALPWW